LPTQRSGFERRFCTVNRSERDVTKVLAGLALGLLLLGGCNPSKPDASNPYAGLDDAIRAWKTDISAADATCRRAPAGEKCAAFEVSCKAQRPITAEDQARGVTAKLVADMSWSGFDDKGAPQPSSAAAQFTRAGGAWTRVETKAVNPETCADLVAAK
jgi:hypothetical protein